MGNFLKKYKCLIQKTHTITNCTQLYIKQKFFLKKKIVMSSYNNVLIFCKTFYHFYMYVLRILKLTLIIIPKIFKWKPHIIKMLINLDRYIGTAFFFWGEGDKITVTNRSKNVFRNYPMQELIDISSPSTPQLHLTFVNIWICICMFCNYLIYSRLKV